MQPGRFPWADGVSHRCLDPLQDASGPFPRFAFGVPQDGSDGNTETDGAVVLGGPRPDVRYLFFYGLQRLPPEGVDVGPFRADFLGHIRRPAKVKGDVGFLKGPDLAEVLFKPVELSVVVEGRGLGPDPPQDLHVLVGAPVAGVVVYPVAVPPLLNVAAAADDVHGDAASGQLVQSSYLAGGQRGDHETGPVGDEISQGLCPGRCVSRDGESLRRGRGIPDQHLVETAGLVGLGELCDVIGVDPGRNLVGGIDAAAEKADRHAPGGITLPVNANHAHYL